VRRQTLFSALAATAVLAAATLVAQERLDQDVAWKIRQEGTARSQIMTTLHMLADVHGPRLTGSPQLKAAGEWARDQMKTWGLTNARLEPWDFGHPGWTNERVTAHIVAPVQDALVVEVLAWTPGTSGVRRGPAVQITLPQRPTRDDLTKHLDGLKDAVRGRMVLVGEPQRVPVTFNAPPLRREDADVVGLLAAPPAQAPPAANAGAGRGGAAATQAPVSPPLTANEIEQQVNLFLAGNGALVRINDAGRDHGQIRAFHNRTFDVAKAPPTLVMRNEDYGRISRLLADKRDVQLEVDIVNRTHADGRTAYNVVAEIPGTDKADEVVMLGGHLDSWHAATGATDNAAGCAVMMDAARILAAIGVKPRRTIRVALWSGEEQGLLGSQAYVKEHFGMAEQPKAAFAKFAGYFNVDNGTGRARGFTVFGPPAAGAVLRNIAMPLADLGVLGATTTRSRVRGGSDHTSFNEAGLPGITVMQDPIQYGTYTWHTNLDTYERIVEDDVKKAAIAVAAAVYQLAMRDELLPRFAASEMPRRPGAEPAATPATGPASTAPAAATQSR
jgi:carboxypeptidase Q